MDILGPATWQESLKQLITDPQIRARLATAVNVSPITLQRWTARGSRPRIDNIRMLAKNVPKESQSLFMSLLVVDFPELLRAESSEERFSQGIPSTFYARVLNNLALTPTPTNRQSTQDLIFQQMLQQFDPDQQGLSVSLAICMPPRPGRKVRSLREIGGLATPPWPRNLAERTMLLGSESLVGHAITHGHSYVINSRDENNLSAVQWTEYEESAAAFPILYRSRVVGGLIVSSAHKHFFTPPRLAVIADYAHLISCIFESAEAFACKEIELGIIPPYTSQLPYFADFQQRISRKLFEANARGQPLTLPQAQLLVWQDLEDLLLQVQLD